MGVMKILGSSFHTDDEREVNDYYATDPQALRDFLSVYAELSTSVWEPACGEGNLSKTLEASGHSVFSTDLVDRGYGSQFNFLDAPEGLKWGGDILTNPPYKLSEKFVRKAMDLVDAGSKVVMLFKLQFVESQKREKLFTDFPIKYIYVHRRRIGIWKNNEPSGGQALCYAWFVWEKGFSGDTVMRWI